MARSIPEEQIAEVQAATDIVELISEYVPLKRKGKDYQALCPFHQEKTPSFSVSPSKQIFKCFGCGAGGDAIGFLMKHEHMEYIEAVRHLADRAGIHLRTAERQDPERGRTRQDLYEVCRWAAEEYHRLLVAAPAGKSALEYLSGRGLTRETIEDLEIGLAPDRWDHLLERARTRRISPERLEQAGLAVRREDGSGYYDRFRHRIIFPICDAQGRPIAFGGRTLGDDPAKYLNSPETPLFNKGRTVYGLHLAKAAISQGRRACVVEGYMDLAMARQHGIGWVVATLGTALTEAHLNLLRRFADVALLVFDGDAAGRAATDRGIELFLQQELEVQVCVLPTGLDPCDFLLQRGAEAFLMELDRAPSAFEYKLADIQARYALDRDVEKRQAIDEALGMLARLPARTQAVWAVRRDLMLAKLAARMGVSEESVRARLADLARPRRRPPRAQTAASTRAYDGLERELVEILLCRPDLADQVGALLPADAMRDETLARLAGRVYEATRDGRVLDLRQVLALAAEAGAADLASAMVAEGEAKGRFEERLAAIRERLAERSARRQRAQLRAQLARVTSDAQRMTLLRELNGLLRGRAPARDQG